MKKLITTVAVVCMTATIGSAQTNDFEAFNRLDLGITAGSTGIGFDLETPFGNSVRFRMGLSVMPHFEKKMNFDIQSFGDDGMVTESNFDRMAELMQGMTGIRPDKKVDMLGKPVFWNYKFLIDVYPFRKKQWHFTAGFHWGPSKVAEAVNTLEDAPSLLAVNIYNNLYQKAKDREPLFNFGTDEEPDYYYIDAETRRKILSHGRMGIHVGEYVRDVVDEEGNVVHQAGAPYMMEPDDDGTVRARVEVNSFKPYLGFGYQGRLAKGDDRYHIAFDCGVMFWGGTPAIITHDGTNLAKDVENIGGKVGRYVDMVSGLKVYPVLNLRISRKLFGQSERRSAIPSSESRYYPSSNTDGSRNIQPSAPVGTTPLHGTDVIPQQQQSESSVRKQKND